MKLCVIDLLSTVTIYTVMHTIYNANCFGASTYRLVSLFLIKKPLAVVREELFTVLMLELFVSEEPRSHLSDHTGTGHKGLETAAN